MATRGLAWMDLETTGLDPHRDEILEVAVVLTTDDLHEIARFCRVVKLTPRGLARLAADPFVYDMHVKSGLLDEAYNGSHAVPIHEAYGDLIRFLSENGFHRGELVISGSGVMTFDMRFIREWMPSFEEWVAYWPNDIGVLRRKLERIGIDRPVVPESHLDGHKKHRALSDALAHLEEDRVLSAFLLKHLPLKDGS